MMLMAARVKHLATAVARQLPHTRRLHVRASTMLLVPRPMHAMRVQALHHAHFLGTKTDDHEVTVDPTASIAADDDVDNDDDEDGDAADDEDGTPSETFLGVTYHADRIKKWGASVTVGQIEVDAGQFWTEEDAAKGYDELVRMYLEPDAPLNFPNGHRDDVDDENEDKSTVVVGGDNASSDWTLPDAGSRHADIIPPIRNTYLTMEELLPALEREQAIDVYSINLEGKSSLASHMVFCTGRSRNHMRRMADMVIISMKAREMQDNFGYVVEGRDCDDWMIADVNNIIVHFMTAETRHMLQLEDHWENMVHDKHRLYGHLSEDEYMDKYGMSGLITDDDFLHEEDIDHTVWK
ncbi:Aste57867_1361 [Aphanomyces stellatus]|uniref:Aste57867_1361 protein n=1 Tax=Aphanomyces stellatus TaxID=120398 RepID=A0A485K631_9STRA|nr:hypothetical protein As57867_001360 [Aphanomyces stellatus]VFT78580.1 Aste57867_1361 [Aphanomyces stellatus]